MKLEKIEADKRNVYGRVREKMEMLESYIKRDIENFSFMRLDADNDWKPIKDKDRYDRITKHIESLKEVLNEIDKRATNTENLISGSQKELLSTITNIINETVIPKKVDKAEEIGMLFFQQLLTDPEKAVNSLNALLPLIDKIEQS